MGTVGYGGYLSVRLEFLLLVLDSVREKCALSSSYGDSIELLKVGRDFFPVVQKAKSTARSYSGAWLFLQGT